MPFDRPVPGAEKCRKKMARPMDREEGELQEGVGFKTNPPAGAKWISSQKGRTLAKGKRSNGQRKAKGEGEGECKTCLFGVEEGFRNGGTCPGGTAPVPWVNLESKAVKKVPTAQLRMGLRKSLHPTTSIGIVGQQKIETQKKKLEADYRYKRVSEGILRRFVHEKLQRGLFAIRMSADVFCKDKGRHLERQGSSTPSPSS